MPVGCPWDCSPAAGAGPPPLLLASGGRGAQVPARFALSPPLFPYSLPASHHPPDHLGGGWASLWAPPFSPSTWVSGGQRTLQFPS